MKTKTQKTATTIKATLLSSSIALMMSNMAYASDKNIGDLEIYQAADGGNAVITMMLDTSGSMSAPIMRDSFGDGGSACELDVKNAYTPSTKQYVDPKYPTIKYTQHFCQPGGPGADVVKKVYAYLYIPSFPVTVSDVRINRVYNPRTGRWEETRTPITRTEYREYHAQCYNTDDCSANRGEFVLGKPPGYDGYTKDEISLNFTNGTRGTGQYLYTKRTIKGPPLSGQPVPDRLTRLKNAVFKLMNDLKGDNIYIGIGQFSSQENGQGDGRTGRILVPVAKLDEAQRIRIKQAIASLEGHNGTPSAQAYAEAGAYMLGTTTRGAGTYSRFQQNGTWYQPSPNPSNIPSGFDKSHADSKNGSNYKSPMLDSKMCDGHGIYFLTDGEPNSSIEPEKLMKIALGNKGSSFSVPAAGNGTLPEGSSRGDNGMPQAGAFAKALRAPGSNPQGVSIRTAVVGFGSVFDVTKYEQKGEKDETKKVYRTLPLAVVNKKTGERTGELQADKPTQYINCALITNIDAQNACNWGAHSHPSLPGVGGYGEGGFYYAQSETEVYNSFDSFLRSLGTEIGVSPSGTISIPRDPLSANNIQPYAYLPMIHPEVAKMTTTWKGNLKKYHTLNGTLYGKGGTTRLYMKPTDMTKPTQGNGDFPFLLNPEAQDLWQTGDSVGNNNLVTVGGVRGRLNHPSATEKANVRSVFVETVVDGERKLQKVGTNGTALIDFDKLGAEYTVLDKAYILNFLGYSVPVEATAYPNATTATEADRQLTEKLETAVFHSEPVLGGVMHSPPVLASYSGELDPGSGNITSDESKRSDFLLYGSMDGALHMVSARTGEESFSFIPRQMFNDTVQRHALLLNSEPTNTIKMNMGEPKFGVDAPWQTYAAYTFGTKEEGEGDDKKKVTRMTATKMFAYGGLRMGGVGLYGLDITSKESPTLAFAINRSSAGFERIGQTWTKPVPALIKTSTGARSSENTKRVLFVSGGYDMCYESPTFALKTDGEAATEDCTKKSMAYGNAIYMIDAEDGTLLQTWTAPGETTSGLATNTDGRQYMKHGIVAEVTPLDRNSNGFVDSIYFADLGGQIFRIDLQEETAPTNSAFTRRVVRVFDANSGFTGTHLPYRFYDKPVVSFYNQPNGRIALVNIATGDRSSPLHKRRELTDANRIYGIIDRDLATPMISAGRGVGGLVSVNITNAALNYYDPAELAGKNAATLIDDLRNGKKQGWYYEMNRFADRIGVKNLKSVGPGAVMGGVYYSSVYSPEYNYQNKAECSASIAGGTERQGYCLPWGICANKNGALLTSNGTVGYSKAGPGIQELAIATLTDEAGKSSHIRTMIGAETYNERVERQSKGYGSTGTNDPFAGAENAGKTGTGANPVEKPVQVATNKVLKVKRWYDLQTAEGNQ